MGCEHTEKVNFKDINKLKSKAQNNLCGACFSVVLVLGFGSVQNKTTKTGD